ncbi:MAG: hypothetical protein V4792_06570 [Pseudomonadota bacterium]
MLVDPQAILDAIEHSAALEALDRKVWRPLERNIVPKVVSGADVAAFDAALDRASDTGLS